VAETISREGLYRIQTPQGFRLKPLREAHERAERMGSSTTDDAQLYELLGKGRVALVPGDAFNLKVTTPEDLGLAEQILKFLFFAQLPEVRGR
jgi:2-C-methyl-D-erythritol 4-phosphate cytidylyltransferase